ncbi:MAG: NnrS family protein, partial [Deltaproteobacteria bacterium]|nr:NnrS family protein [Deltaproteobacteria bacterium]
MPIPLGPTSQRWQGPVFLASGHRSMFLAAGLFAPLALTAWLLAWRGHLPLSPWWHGHELIFGFAVAAIGGFLQAAVPKWTQGPLFRGTRAGVLAAAWLLGRLGMALTPVGIPAWPLDLLFLPVLAGWVGLDILRAKNARNYQVVAMLLALWGLNLHYHLAPGAAHQTQALHAAVYLIAALIALIGGRIVPSFTQNALRQAGHAEHACTTPPWLDRAAVPLVALVVVLELVAPFSTANWVVALAAAGVTGLRMRHWRTWQTRRLPLVWVLHAGYAFIPLGFLLKGISALGGPIGAFAALHALTAGAIGVMILAVASRAAL